MKPCTSRDVGRGRGQPGADRPDRLVGDHQIGAGGAVGQRAGELAADDIERLAGLALGPLSRRRRRSRSAPPARRPAPWRAPGRRSRDGRRGARNGRRSRRVAPASASISAEMSPVWAPDGLAWQSCAPMATAEPRAAAAKRASKVAGGHTIRSALPAMAAAPATILSSSATEAASPFIFQLPATSGRRLAPAMLNSFSRCG